jgi:hypothetical protein
MARHASWRLGRGNGLRQIHEVSGVLQEMKPDDRKAVPIMWGTNVDGGSPLSGVQNAHELSDQSINCQHRDVVRSMPAV